MMLLSPKHDMLEHYEWICEPLKFVLCNYNYVLSCYNLFVTILSQ